MASAEELYKKILSEAEKDNNIIGFWLDGSRGKGMVTVDSDYDCKMVVKDGKEEEYREKYKTKHNAGVDIGVMSLTEFMQYAAWGSRTHWDRYNFSHLVAAVDKNGEIQKLINEKGSVPSDKIRENVEFWLHAYLNKFYRSLKCFRDNNIVGARFEAAESIAAFLEAIFTKEGRQRPYYKYLEFELERYPLKESPFDSKLLGPNLLKILTDGDLLLQKEIFKWAEKTFKKNGYGEVFNEWQGFFDEFLK